MQQSQIRNFAIIAHVDHGKSTLADRLLEITKTIPKEKMAEQFLDQNPISRRRGITIKLAPVRMRYKISNPKSQIPNKLQNSNSNAQNSLELGALDLELTDSKQEFVLNLIDTPGHVDFSYEVSRTLAAIDGAILLVDATQGIQAQTVAHYREAIKQKLTLIPVINKVDLPNAQRETVANELANVFGFKKEEIIYISAKTGENVSLLLEEIVKRVPAPSGQKEKPLRALIFDAVYDEFRGVVAYVKVVDGQLKKHDVIRSFQNNITSEVSDVGYFSPNLVSSNVLETGEIGYVITGIKDIRQARIGDTITIDQNSKLKTQNYIEALPGYKLPKPMVFFGAYPKNTKDFAVLKESLAKLTLNDTALTYTEEYSSYLGSGFRVGFLGLLHAEIVKERLKEEFGLDALYTMPQVLYENSVEHSAEQNKMYEPYIKLIVYTPKDYVGAVMNLCQSRKGTLMDLSYHESYAVLSYELPYSMFIRGLSSDLKSVSNGYASIDYTLIDYRQANLAQLEIRVNDVAIDVLSELVYKDESTRIAREKALALKNSLPRLQFRQIIQVVVDGNILAREEIPPFRKDVLQKMSGGDRRRKDKLLEAQKKGKSKLIARSKINIPQEALISMIKNT
jgi:GTP-binding protein LepA